MEQITVEWVDKQIADYEKKHPEKIAIRKGIDICAIVNKALPILRFVQGLLFWKPKWKKIIQQVIDAAALICTP